MNEYSSRIRSDHIIVEKIVLISSYAKTQNDIHVRCFYDSAPGILKENPLLVSIPKYQKF